MNWKFEVCSFTPNQRFLQTKPVFIWCTTRPVVFRVAPFSNVMPESIVVIKVLFHSCYLLPPHYNSTKFVLPSNCILNTLALRCLTMQLIPKAFRKTFAFTISATYCWQKSRLEYCQTGSEMLLLRYQRCLSSPGLPYDPATKVGCIKTRLPWQLISRVRDTNEALFSFLLIFGS